MTECEKSMSKHRPDADNPWDNMAEDQIPIQLDYLDFTNDAVYFLDLDGNILYLNQAASKLLVMERNEKAPIGQRWITFVHEDDRSRFLTALQECRNIPGEVNHIEYRLVGPAGDIIFMRHRLKMIVDNRLGLMGFMGIGTDIQEIRILEDQLHQSQKLESVGMMTGGIAHDFNNMLAAILGYTELMLEDKKPDDPDIRALSYIQTSTERAAMLVKQLLVFSRKSAFELRPVHLGKIINETMSILQRTLPRNIRIITSLSLENDQVMGDSGRLQQAFMNLCLNARDSMPDGGELRIDMEQATTSDIRKLTPKGRSTSYICVRIQDTGTGMSPETQRHIFEPFFTTKPAELGTGLGLSVLRGILQAHKGFVQVKSQVGQGAVFSVYLPAVSQEELQESVHLIEPEGGNETALIVDDEPVLLDLLAEMLKGKGYKVLKAESGENALQILDEIHDKIDIVISDNMMPGISGKELADEIKNNYPGIHVMMCSGYHPIPKKNSKNEPDDVTFIQKPYQRKELLRKVRETLDSSKKRT
jgi:PAS domain S-box-containing protein